MIGFIIIAICLLFFIGICWYLCYLVDYENSALLLLLITLIVVFIIIIIAIPCSSMSANSQIRQYKQYQEMIDETYSNNKTDNYAINLKVAEYNEWLIQAQDSNRTYSIFSFYKDEVQDLEYIKIKEVE